MGSLKRLKWWKSPRLNLTSPKVLTSWMTFLTATTGTDGKMKISKWRKTSRTSLDMPYPCNLSYLLSVFDEWIVLPLCENRNKVHFRLIKKKKSSFPLKKKKKKKKKKK